MEQSLSSTLKKTKSEVVNVAEIQVHEVLADANEGEAARNVDIVSYSQGNSQRGNNFRRGLGQGSTSLNISVQIFLAMVVVNNDIFETDAQLWWS